LLYRQDDRYVLIYSPGGVVKYLTGTLTDLYTFVPEISGVVDYGGWEGYYAPNCLVDDTGRRILFGWMPEVARGDFEGGAGWAGIQALPRELALTASGRLLMRPVPELRKLRGRHSGLSELITEGASGRAGIEGRAIELIVELELAGAESLFSIDILRSGNGRERTRIAVDSTAGVITIDRSQSSLSPLPHGTPITGSYESNDGRLRLHIFVDNSTIEIFCNETTCLSTRVYPTLHDSTGVMLHGESAHANLLQFDAWELSTAK
jgi:beta-fructofuranosidase